MMVAEIHPRLIDRLPVVRGELVSDADLSRVTWFRVGGPAEVMFRPADRDDLAEFLRAKPADEVRPPTVSTAAPRKNPRRSIWHEAWRGSAIDDC